jgi:hypothetical protein
MTTTTVDHEISRTFAAQPACTSELTPDAEPRIKVIAILAVLLPAIGYLVPLISKSILVNSADPITNSFWVAQLVVTLVPVFLFPLLVLLIFQIGKRFRNPRSRWHVFLYTGLFFLGYHFLAITLEAISILKLSVIYAGVN